MTNEHEYDQPATYQIRLKGVLDPSWSDWFGGLTITPVDDETMLEGQVADQAGLHGILAKINDLGLSIISVEQVLPVQGENLES
jgi:hypothetical protein